MPIFLELTKIYLSSKKTFSYFLNNALIKFLFPFVFGIASSMSLCSWLHLGDSCSLKAIWVLILVLGPFFGFFYIYLGAFVYRALAGYFLGTDDYEAYIHLLFWSNTPLIGLLLVWFGEIFFDGLNHFQKKATLGLQGNLYDLFLIFSILEIGFKVWIVFLQVFGISEINSFSKTKSLVVVIGSSLIIQLPLGTFILIIRDIGKSTGCF